MFASTISIQRYDLAQGNIPPDYKIGHKNQRWKQTKLMKQAEQIYYQTPLNYLFHTEW